MTPQSTGNAALDLAVVFFLLAGSFFVFVAALGLLRFSDVLLRMHAATKAGTLGAGLLLVAVALYFFDLAVATRAVAGIFFLLLTAPVAAHLVGRATYWSDTPLDPRTSPDELRGHYGATATTDEPDSGAYSSTSPEEASVL